MATMYYPPFKDYDSSGFPSTDAIEKVLPDYKYIFYDPKRQRDEVQSKGEEPESGSTSPPSKGKQPADNRKKIERKRRESDEEDDYDDDDYQNDINVLESTQITLLDYQMKELENYRVAVHKMGKDILMLRDQIVTLQDENQMLRRQLNKHDETRMQLLEASMGDFENIDKGELIVRYMTLKQKTLSQAEEVQHSKELVTKLQAELKRKDDREDSYKELKDAHYSQSKNLQKLQEKAAKVMKMEEACRQQEKVIERMEKLLNSKKLDTSSATSTLAQENQRLRAEIERLKERGGSESERLKLYEQLEKSESRVTSLERKLAENSREWARDKSELLMKLREAEYGFGRTQSPLDIPRATRSYDRIEPRNRFQTNPMLQPIRR